METAVLSLLFGQIGAVVGDWGYLGGQIMFTQLAVVSILVFIARQTIPESPVWIKTHEDRLADKVSEQAQGKISDLFKSPYAKPFIALAIFYIGTNIPANSLGRFSTWIGANVVSLPISVVSTIDLICYPIRAILDFVFMKFVDTDKRMPLFYMGAALYLLGFLLFPPLLTVPSCSFRVSCAPSPAPSLPRSSPWLATRRPSRSCRCCA